MLKHTVKFAFLAFLALGLGSCGRQVTRVEPETVIDLSGRWNDTDSRLTADAMIEQVLGEPWLENFKQANNGDRPVVIVGLVQNKSHEHIDAETFIKDVERAFIKTQKVRLVQGGEKREQIREERAAQQNYSSKESMKKWGMEVGADYMLQGTINSIVDQYKKDKVVNYKINLELTDIETSEVVWIGDKEIKKMVKD